MLYHSSWHSEKTSHWPRWPHSISSWSKLDFNDFKHHRHYNVVVCVEHIYVVAGCSSFTNWGENPRYTHTFHDEDAMMWLKRFSNQFDAHNTLTPELMMCYMHVLFQTLFQISFFDVIELPIDGCWGISLGGHQNPSKQRAWCLRLSRLRTDMWVMAFVKLHLCASHMYWSRIDLILPKACNFGWVFQLIFKSAAILKGVDVQKETFLLLRCKGCFLWSGRSSSTLDEINTAGSDRNLCCPCQGWTFHHPTAHEMEKKKTHTAQGGEFRTTYKDNSNLSDSYESCCTLITNSL